MDDTTLQVIIGRFDRLDLKIDGALAEHNTLRVRVAELEGEISATKTVADSLVSEATFKRRASYVVSAVVGAIAGFLGFHIPAFRK